MRKIFFTLLLASLLYPLSLVVAHAQQAAPALNLTVTPATLDLTANPGTTAEQKIRIRNNTSNPIDLSIETNKLSTNANGDVIPVQSKDTYLSWISYSPATFTAQPNEWTDITVQIKIPDSAAFGYYYAIRITPTNSIAKKNTNGSTLIGEALVPLLLNVKKPGAHANIQLVSFAATQPFYEYLPATLAITLVNKGNVHIRPQGNVFIRTNGSDDIAILDFNEANGAMLPGQKRTYTASWDDGFFSEEPTVADGTLLRDSNGNPKKHLVIHWDHLTAFRIGKYTAQLLAVYDNGSRDVPIEATATFWVFPWKIIGGMVIGIIMLIFVTRMWLGWYVKRQIKKYQKG